MNTPRIKIVTGYDGDLCYRDLLEKNIGEYCERWAHEFVSKFDGWKPTSHHLFWRKLEIVQESFHDCDWLIWLDADCFVLNMTTPITKYLGSFDIGVTGPFETTCNDKQCNQQCDAFYSSGIFFLRNTEWSHAMLEKWWKFREEDQSHHECMDSGDSAYISTCIMREPESLAHATVLPLREIGWATVTGDHEQFITHCYGSTNEQREERFRLCERNLIR